VRPRRVALALAAITAIGAALRFWRIGHQSYWLDESFTVALVDQGFADAMSTIAETESTPPVYYALAWAWSQVLGTGEAGLRSLSALIGTITIPVFYLVARELFGDRAGLIAAALAALNPYLWWYSQEARAYALLVLLSAVSLLFLARAVRDPRGRWLGLWALSSALALSTHYFAGFLLLGEAVWLLRGRRSPAAMRAVLAVVAVAGALVPLALDQRATGHTLFIGDIALIDRVGELPKKFVTGELGSPVQGLGPVAGVIVALGLLGLARLRGYRFRWAIWLLALTAITAAAPIVMAIAGTDYLLPRNLMAMYAPFTIALAAGFGGSRGGRVGPTLAAALCATAAFVCVWTSFDESVQRDDWRDAARALGPVPNGDRAIVLNPEPARKPLQLYAGRLERIDPRGAAPSVLEVIAIGNARPPNFPEPQPPAVGFQRVERRVTETYELVRWRAPAAPVPVLLPELEAARLDDEVPGLFLQRAGG
jgi:mannosyltransferase